MDKLASMIGGSHSGDIVSTNNVDIKAVRLHEQEQLEKRIQEESGEVKKRKCIPVEYLLLFGQVPRLDQVQVMKPKDLTKEDAVRFIEAGCTRMRLADLYGMSVGKLYALLAEWGLYTPKRQQAAKKQEYTPVAPETKKQEYTPAVSETEKPDIIWFMPQQKTAKITVSKSDIIYLNCNAIDLAPAEYQTSTIKLKIGFSKDGGDLIILKPAQDGYIFRNDSRWKKNLRGSSTLVTKYLQEQGVVIPAEYDAEWDPALNAWVGRLIRENQGQEAV